MRRSSRFRELHDSLGSEDGSAAIEFIVAGMILLVPLVYLILAMSSIQAGALGVEGAARQAARVYVRSATPADARANAGTAIRFALADYGLSPSDTSVTVTCAPNPNACLTRRGFVTVRVQAHVVLPLSPTALGVGALSVPLSATATQQVSRFWGAG